MQCQPLAKANKTCPLHRFTGASAGRLVNSASERLTAGAARVARVHGAAPLAAGRLGAAPADAARGPEKR